MRPSLLQAITLHLARAPDHPAGSAAHGYEFFAPLDDGGLIDLQAWRTNQEACTVRRFWRDEADRFGRLRHRAGGAAGATWIFDYDATTRSDDENGFRFGDHRFVVGEYVSIRDPDDILRTFRVADVAPAAAGN